MKTFKKDDLVRYTPPNGEPRKVRFVRALRNGPSGLWYELREVESKPRGPTFRARPGNCS